LAEPRFQINKLNSIWRIAWTVLLNICNHHIDQWRQIASSEKSYEIVFESL